MCKIAENTTKILIRIMYQELKNALIKMLFFKKKKKNNPPKNIII